MPTSTAPDPQALADFESPMCARSTPNVPMAELRMQVPRHFLEVFDAVSIARDQERHQLVTEELQKIVNQFVHEASLIHRLLRGNPTLLDTAGEGSKTGSGAQQ